MAQKLSEIKKRAKEERDALFLDVIQRAKSPEQAALRLGVSVSTVMRFKRQAGLTKSHG